MFSLDNFYYILYKNLLQPASITPAYFLPFGSVDPKNLTINDFSRNLTNKDQINHMLPDISLFYDQEPLIENFTNKLLAQPITTLSNNWICKLLANSEHSAYKKDFCKQNKFIDWYYFFHGFAALDWYRDYLYLPDTDYKIDKVFISLNRLVTKDRSYRLNLVSHFIEKELIHKGHVSLILSDLGFGIWNDEVNDMHTKLSANAKSRVLSQLSKLHKPLLVDYEQPPGQASASVSNYDVMMNKNAFWHIVSETVFYYPKLHLTEKIFKPIVSKRPFILVAAPGNLAYLKSYGFKTFDRWIDESYDQIEDNDLRIAAITDQVERLCKLGRYELETMHKEMQEILEYNFDHFFKGEFKKIIVNEMVDNFETCLRIWNVGLSPSDDRGLISFYPLYKNIDNINFAKAKEMLLQ